ncbi:MAG: hypothetical protein E7413_03500 [Ruminococcaceae bacterium]|nr:hypothetical protein [Oscillospiraceae bacterium]
MKKMKKLLLLFLATTLCLTACQAQNSEPVSEEEEEKLPQEDIVNYMALTYVNGASTDANYAVETDIELPERHFLFEDVVSNPAELMAYEYFYAIGTGDYEYLVNHIVGSDLKRKMQSVVDADANGLFYKTLTLHEMEIVPIEEFFDFEYAFCEEVATLAGTAKLTEYTVVKARASYEFNDLSLEANPELVDDEVTLYIFVGRTDGDYFLFEAYGEDFVKNVTEE